MSMRARARESVSACHPDTGPARKIADIGAELLIVEPACRIRVRKSELCIYKMCSYRVCCLQNIDRICSEKNVRVCEGGQRPT